MPSEFIPQRGPRTRKHKAAADDLGLAPTPTKVFIAMPAGDDVKTGFAYDLAHMVGSTAHARPDIDIALNVTKMTILQQSRTTLVKAALSWPGCTHILWLDTDMRFKKDTLIRLLSHREPIVGAAYSSRSNPIQPVTYIGDVDRPNPERFFLEPDAVGLQEVTGAGFGVMLTEIDVFRKLSKPWFAIGYSEGADEFEGEDIYFCSKARKAGYRVFVDCELSQSIGHLGEYQYGNADANNFRAVMQLAEAGAATT